MLSLSLIRQTFIDYFVKHGHTHVPSSPLVPQNDPTLMFTAAGMVQFKDLFTGHETRSYKRAVTAQKCFRAGGKHNDLDNVGYTARHHTFFEMLGNFSFADYFKEEAILFAYELITKDFALDKKRLCVTVYADDDEAAQLWQKIGGFTGNKIIRISTADNFWSMGDTGPCGPCSEIFFDYGDSVKGGPPGSANEDGDRFVEIWNLVFMQYEQMADGSRTLLPKPSIDTGMGLERIACVLQGKHNNFECDAFQELVDLSKFLTKNIALEHQQSHYVIADHLRAAAFLIADGVLPSNEGRGYVLRRILRRAMRHAHILGANNPLLCQMVGTLVSVMGESFNELCRAKTLVEQTLLLEEERFNQTLERGLKVLYETTQHLKKDEPLPGDIAFKLYDTYGFPLDLTQDVLRADSRLVDTKRFELCMQEQKQRARASWRGSGDSGEDVIWHDVRQKNGATEFLGYNTLNAEGMVLDIVQGNVFKEEACSGEEVWVVLNQTPFYAESGGQVGDIGQLRADDCVVMVTNCVKKAGVVFVHQCYVKTGTLKKNASVHAEVDETTRRRTAAHHSATHLLQAALKDILGEHVCQKGSYVDANRLRFDFTHPKALGCEEVLAVENLVNLEIQKNHTTHVVLSTPDKAIAAGALALFGERYGDEVRVVSFGDTQPGRQFSVELCGGTHVKATGEIGLFKIVSETSVAAGVRRIDAIVGLGVLDKMRDLEEKITTLQDSQRKTMIDSQKKIEHLTTQLAMAQCATLHHDAKMFHGMPMVFKALKDIAAKDLKTLTEYVVKNLTSGLVILVSEIEGKACVVIGVSNDLTPKMNAVDLVKESALFLGGKGGGGKPELAQGGGDLTHKIVHLKNHLENIIEKII